MSREEIMKKVIEVFRDVFDDDQIELRKETSAKDIEDWDSLMHITLVTALEKEFDINFKLKEVIELQNVGDTIELIERKLSE